METNVLNVIVAAFVGIGTFIAGWPWQLLIIFAIFMVLDIITGIIKGLKKGNWSSKQMKQGLLKKAGECIVLMSTLLVQVAAVSMGIPVPLGSILVGVFIIKEFGSILENATEMGIEIPSVIKKWLKVANDKINSEDK